MLIYTDELAKRAWNAGDIVREKNKTMGGHRVWVDIWKG